jgi:hypothetical protein
MKHPREKIIFHAKLKKNLYFDITLETLLIDKQINIQETASAR